MPKQITLQLSPKQAADPKTYVSIAARRAGVAEGDVALVRVVKRSVDARQARGAGAVNGGGAVKVNLTVDVYVDGESRPAEVRFDYPYVGGKTPVVIVGGGPAGLFCALGLIEAGLRPIILERGKEVAERGKDIARLNKNEGVDPDSNYAFGEGGAGTFSDGKLFTRSKKRGDYDRALRVLVHHGASEEILYEAHPHIGTDKLPRIMTAIRETISGCGGEVIFGARVDDVKIVDGRVHGVYINGGTLVEGAAVVLATGHSARDIYEILHARGVALEAKPFAMGVRIEHPQALIDRIQYHTPEGRGEWLPAASYQLVDQVGTSADKRGVYSFCMCPGGFIVPAMTAPGESVVNGMSPSLRNSPFANSGIVTEVRLSDFGYLREEVNPLTGKQFGELAGLEFQRRLERVAKSQESGVRSQESANAGGKLDDETIRRLGDGANAGASFSGPQPPPWGPTDGFDEAVKPAALRHQRLITHDSSLMTSAVAPAQRVADFVSARPSGSLPASSYVPGLAPSRLDEWLPRFISQALRSGISSFGRRMKGFVTNEAVVVGVESRTSTPVRIPRDPTTMQHPQIANLYPAGEGAGYAGGIISSALDGTRIAEAIANSRNNL